MLNLYRDKKVVSNLSHVHLWNSTISKEKLIDFNKQIDVQKKLMFERGPDFQSAYEFKRKYIYILVLSKDN